MERTPQASFCLLAEGLKYFHEYSMNLRNRKSSSMDIVRRLS